MEVRSMNIYELKAWINENKSKIDESLVKNVHSTYCKGIIFELYKKNLNKKYLYLIPSIGVFLSDKKVKISNTNLVQFLRKIFKGKKIKINIVDDEKVVKVSSDSFSLYVELFKNGNVVVVDKNDRILYALEYKNYGIRKVFKGEVYHLPPVVYKIPENYEEFLEILHNNKDKKIVSILASFLRLGKNYAEKVLTELKIEKNKKVKELTESEKKSIWNTFKNFLKWNKIKITDTDFFLSKEGEAINNVFEKIYINFLKNYEIIKIEEKRKKIEEILKTQEEKIRELRLKEEEYKKIGDFLMTFHWIFDKKNLEEIKKELESLGVKVKSLRRLDYKTLEIEVEDLSF